MPGELWTQEVRVAKETTIGVPVTPATRRLYLTEPQLTDDGEASFHEFATGTPDNVREVTPGSKVVGGSCQVPVSAEEMIELALCTIKGDVTPATPSGATLTRDWVFTPSVLINAMTMEYHDGANPWRASGVQGNSLEISGAAGPGETNIASFELMGADLLPAPLTGVPAERIPTFVEGWETEVSFGAFGANPATLPMICSFVKNWTVRYNNNMERKYLACNTQSADSLVRGTLGVEHELTVEAKNPQSIAEFNNWRAATRRMVRLKFGQNRLIEAGAVDEVQAFEFASTATGGTYTLALDGIVSAPITFSSAAAAIQTALTTAWGAGTVVVTGGPPTTAPVIITFAGTKAGVAQNAIVANGSSLVPVTNIWSWRQVRGGGFYRTVIIDLPGAWRAIGLSETDAGTRMYRLMGRYIYDPTNGFGFRMTCRGNRATAF